MASVTLTATPAGRRYHAMIEIAGVIINSAETYPPARPETATSRGQRGIRPHGIRIDRPQVHRISKCASRPENHA